MIIRRITAVLVCKMIQVYWKEFACTRDPIKATTGSLLFRKLVFSCLALMFTLPVVLALHHLQINIYCFVDYVVGCQPALTDVSVGLHGYLKHLT